MNFLTHLMKKMKIKDIDINFPEKEISGSYRGVGFSVFTEKKNSYTIKSMGKRFDNLSQEEVVDFFVSIKKGKEDDDNSTVV